MAANKPQFIIVHHTAVSYAKNADQFEATRRYHISKGWGDIGYHYEIAKNGTVHKGRGETVIGAHTSQDNMNARSLGICLDGNFDIELPTKEQENSLRDLIKGLLNVYKIPVENILPHRHWAKYKSCYGSNLSNDWAQNLLKTKPKKMSNAIIVKKEGSTEIGIYLPAGSPEALISMGANYGIDIPTLPKGGVDFNKLDIKGFLKLK